MIPASAPLVTQHISISRVGRACRDIGQELDSERDREQCARITVADMRARERCTFVKASTEKGPSTENHVIALNPSSSWSLPRPYPCSIAMAHATALSVLHCPPPCTLITTGAWDTHSDQQTPTSQVPRHTPMNATELQVATLVLNRGVTLYTNWQAYEYCCCCLPQFVAPLHHNCSTATQAATHFLNADADIPKYTRKRTHLNPHPQQITPRNWLQTHESKRKV